MLSIDGRAVEGQGRLLDLCRAVGADVPAFCFDDHLSAGGHCRACMVEVDGRFVAACTTQVRDGMVVRTQTDALQSYRRDLGELMRAEADPAGEVGAALGRMGVTGRYGKSDPTARIDHSHPYLRVDLDKCILCRRCMRACDERQGQFVLAVGGRGSRSALTWKEGSFAESGCVSCGACAATCPTEALTDIDRLRASGAERVIRTTCAYCGVGCQLLVHTDGKAVVRIEGADAPPNRGHLCVKGRYAHSFVRHPDRLTTPLVRDGDRLVPTTWEDALSRVRAAFTGPKVAGLSSSRCTNEENYLFQKWFRSVLRTNNVDCCARVCHAPTAMGMRLSLGTGAATNTFDDVERADLILAIGTNATEAHPVMGARIRQAVLDGATLLVIDPRRTELAALANVHLRVRPGANVPLLNAFARVLIDEGYVDQDFVAARVDGFDELHLPTPEEVEPITGVPAADVRRAACLYGAAPNPLMVHGLGVTEHLQGSEAARLICNLALLRGAIGRPGVGVNPLRGQNNVQGAADMGCQPDSLTGYQDPANPEVQARFAAIWGKPAPVEPGMRLPEMLAAARAGELDALYIFGEDPVHSDPDTAAVIAAIDGAKFVVVQEIFLSETAKRADVVLPGAAFLEKDGTFTNGERRVQRVRKVLDPPGNAKTDLDIFAALLGRPTTASQVMDEIARVWPAWGGMSYSRLEAGGLHWPVPNSASNGTPILHAASFPMGKARLANVEFIPSPSFDAPLVLTTGRALQHYNTGSMTRRTPNARLHPEDLLEIHPLDADARGIHDGVRVRLRSDHGEAHARAQVTDRVRPGNVFLTFHHPETGTNAVLGEVHDRLSGCPEYKVQAIEVVPEG